MRKYTAKVIKSGNSYALRISKQLVDDAQLQVGESVTLPLLQRTVDQDQDQIQNLLKELQALKPYSEIKDPVAWQRKVREDRQQPGRE